MTTAERRGHQAAAAEGEMAALCFPLLVISARTICTIRDPHICTGLRESRRQGGKKEANGAGVGTAEEAQTQLQRGRRRRSVNVGPGRRFIPEHQSRRSRINCGRIWSPPARMTQQKVSRGRKGESTPPFRSPSLYLLRFCMAAGAGWPCSWSDHSEDN